MATRTSRGRSALVGILFVLACIGVTLSTIAVWAHQTVLGTDRFVAVTSRIIAEPQVQEVVADRLATQVVVAADVQGRITGVLPPNQAFLAVPITSAVDGFIEGRLRTFLGTERAQEVFATALRVAHARTLTFLRGDGEFATINGSTVTIDLLPIAVEGLRSLQEAGILPADVTLPDVSDPAGRDAVVAQLESRLGRDLPDGFAQISIADATQIQTAQTAVRAFDIAVIVIVVVTIALLVGTVVLSRRRLRMVGLLALGVVVSLVIARLVIRAALQGLASSLATEDGAVALTAVIRDLTGELASWSWLLVILGLIVAGAAAIAGRPAWVTSGVAAASAPTSRGDRLAAWVQAHTDGIAWAAGILLVVILLWIALSPELAILGGIGLLLLARSGVGRRRSSGEPEATPVA